MSTDNLSNPADSQPLGIFAHPELHRFISRVSVKQYHQFGASGVIPKATELIRGVVTEKMSQSPLHCYLLQVLNLWLSGALPKGFLLRQAQPLSTSDSEPEPDLALVNGNVSDFASSHPTTARLVIEVAISSEKLDEAKTSIYAEAEVDEYWIVYGERQYVQVHRRPVDGRYSETLILRPGDVLTPGGLPGEQLPIADLFPPSAE